MLFISVTECSKGSIGGGGFADIYKGIFNEQRVALKRLRVFMMTEESRRPEMMKAFYHECLLWRNLSHKHILPILGIDNQLFNGSLCMVMPWMEHGNIRTVIDVMRNQGSKSPADLQLQVYHWMAEIVSGLAYLHEEGIAHGDVNILIDDSYHVHLADFGLAVFADGASNNYGSMRGGALRWLSPELIDPEELGLESSRPTYASDIYSFACLYTSQSPFFGMPDGTVLVRVLAGKRPKRPTFHGGVEMTDALWDILNRCWAQSASDRPLASEIVTLIDALDEY
ncbi:hypothetical protein EUX98_g1593 [Antrodiella citrinella]|uniref:Protein kinase domain-containing protein n=1 Tax=Antrodiella citrinella TaxID=2447956 RepID=A0A4S4N9G0_9APHY|nr:hypothetical protein EUX98_g1593 [Antrodiella citrinella]